MSEGGGEARGRQAEANGPMSDSFNTFDLTGKIVSDSLEKDLRRLSGPSRTLTVLALKFS